MRELLAENGSIYVHIDWHVGHYVMMDEIFGYENFISQIVWQRTDAHSNVTRKYGTVHDIILFYGKSISCKINLIADLDKLSSSAIKEYSLIQLKNGRLVPYKEGLEGRRVKLDDITVPNVKAGKLFLRDPQKGAARCKVSYLDERLGIIPQDIWINVGRMKGGSRFNTEKPERLLQRIINISSDPGDIVADFFCGSGTTLAAAEKLGRRWLGCDLSKFAVQVTRKRLLDIHNSKDLQE
jgi:DNA modification methylase